jgi:hypothetical protein
MKKLLVVMVAAIALSGCKTSYTWTSDVPARLRTVCVPNFRNESDVTELGTLAALQTLREFQREGTFKLAGHDDAAVEVQGVVKRAYSSFTGADRKTQNRLSDFSYTMIAEVSVVDRVNGRVIVDNKTYFATTSYMAGQDDNLTAQRDASGRLADDLARQIVDDVLSVQW